MASAQIAWSQKQQQLPYIGDISKTELSKHNTINDCWVSFQGEVYNMTPYLSIHPGGIPCIENCAGGDMTEEFMSRHRWVSPNLFSKLKIGRLI